MHGMSLMQQPSAWAHLQGHLDVAGGCACGRKIKLQVTKPASPGAYVYVSLLVVCWPQQMLVPQGGVTFCTAMMQDTVREPAAHSIDAALIPGGPPVVCRPC